MHSGAKEQNMIVLRKAAALGALLFSMLLLLVSCYGVRPSAGGGEGVDAGERKVNAADIALPEGYVAEVVARGLTFPTGIAFDEIGQPYVVESGYSYGEVWTTPRLLKINADGSSSTVAEGTQNGPWNGVAYYDGHFYVAEGGAMEGGKILRINAAGEIIAIVENLPALGDHHTNGPVVANGSIYFGIGTATNAGIVGADNASFGWLERNPGFHDIPCQDVVLNGVNYETGNPLQGGDDKVQTGAFVPFGTATNDGQIIAGALPCSGAVFRVPLQGGALQLVAWGFRNPFGFAVHQGQLYVTDNAYDDRGSRPAWGTGDVLWKVEEDAWYGWPDYSAGLPLNDPLYKIPGKGAPRLLLKELPGTPPAPAAILGVHSSSNGVDFSTSDDFGFTGHAFVAQFGDMAPNVGKVLSPVGFKVVKVDPAEGVVTDFAVNKGKKNGPASQLTEGGLERPVAVRFHPNGKSLYVVDFGVVEINEGEVISRKATGVVWKITKR